MSDYTTQAMNDKELQQLKKRYFGASSKKHGIPLKFFELPPEAVARYEQEKAQIKQDKKVRRQQVMRASTRGEVSIQRRTRRSVGDYSIGEP